MSNENYPQKLACLLSGAVMLCGASAIPANAALSDYANYVASTSTAQQNNFYLSGYNIELTTKWRTTVSVLQSSSYTLPANATVSYQWYKDGSAISGATGSSRVISAEGVYFCRVTVKTPYKNKAGTRTLYNAETFDTKSATAKYRLEIASQPTGGTFDTNKGYFDMFVSVTGGTAPYKYKWYWNGKETSLTGI